MSLMVPELSLLLVQLSTLHDLLNSLSTPVSAAGTANVLQTILIRFRYTSTSRCHHLRVVSLPPSMEGVLMYHSYSSSDEDLERMAQMGSYDEDGVSESEEEGRER